LNVKFHHPKKTKSLKKKGRKKAVVKKGEELKLANLESLKKGSEWPSSKGNLKFS
jgi:hypothetical protein